MSAWRRRAIEAFPDLRQILESPETTLYTLFFELLPICRSAHEARDSESLRRIYDFATWCARQPEPELWNAAGVGFFEHLPDARATKEAIPAWVPRDVFEDVAELLEARIGVREVASIRAAYGRTDAS